MKRTRLIVLALIASGCGPPDGPWEEYHENGQLSVTATYKDGELDGPFEFYDEDGQLRMKMTYKDGEFDGPFEFYDEDGQLSAKGTYKDGEQQCGEWLEEGETVTYDPCPPGN